jgi:hypothetical protein
MIKVALAPSERKDELAAVCVPWGCRVQTFKRSNIQTLMLKI